MSDTAGKLFNQKDLVLDNEGPPRYEQLARFIERAIIEGRLSPGDRLPTVRRLASDLGLSATTINSAFDILSERRLIRPEVGRGTFVNERPRDGSGETGLRFPRSLGGMLTGVGRVPWRRRALMSLGARLRTAYPDSTDCSTGRPDPNLLPLRTIHKAWATAVESATARDLQYAGPEAVPVLASRLVSLLESDHVPVRAEDLIIGSSAQQFLVLCLQIVAGLWGAENAMVAVEEPGYPTIFDTFERAGAKLIGIAVDESGALPESLDAALKGGAKAVLFTPRAHNPTGASWSAERAAALGEVLAAHRDVIAIEDDQFAGVCYSRPGSLLADQRVESRVIYVRSFSKSIGPDLRIAVAAARPQLRELLAEAKSFADGWTSRLLQKTLAGVLSDDETYAQLDLARDSYRERRRSAADVVNAVLGPHGGGTWCGSDGLNLWVHLPAGVDARDAVERAAAEGVRVAEGEPFFLRPGHSGVVRLNAGSVPAEAAVKAARALADSALACGWRRPGPIHV
jgi:GntR family transcriptional regulator / MocR family aminotransferase